MVHIVHRTINHTFELAIIERHVHCGVNGFKKSILGNYEKIGLRYTKNRILMVFRLITG